MALRRTKATMGGDRLQASIKGKRLCIRACKVTMNIQVVLIIIYMNVYMYITCKVVDSVNDIKRLRCFCSVFVTQSVLEHTTKRKKEKKKN